MEDLRSEDPLRLERLPKSERPEISAGTAETRGARRSFLLSAHETVDLSFINIYLDLTLATFHKI